MDPFTIAILVGLGLVALRDPKIKAALGPDPTPPPSPPLDIPQEPSPVEQLSGLLIGGVSDPLAFITKLLEPEEPSVQFDSEIGLVVEQWLGTGAGDALVLEWAVGGPLSKFSPTSRFAIEGRIASEAITVQGPILFPGEDRFKITTHDAFIPAIQGRLDFLQSLMTPVEQLVAIAEESSGARLVKR